MCMWEVPYYMVLVINVARPVQLHLSTAQPCRGFLQCHHQLFPDLMKLSFFHRVSFVYFADFVSLALNIRFTQMASVLHCHWLGCDICSSQIFCDATNASNAQGYSAGKSQLYCGTPPSSPKAYSESFPCVIPWLSCSLTYDITY